MDTKTDTKIKVGDLIKVRDCFDGKWSCDCLFCTHHSNRVGIVIQRSAAEDPDDEFTLGWDVQFDCGSWEIYPSDIRNGDMEVISEHR